MTRLALTAAVLAAATPLVQAWNEAGHRAIAFLAYSHLNLRAKTRVAAILRAHPDFGAILSRGASWEPFDVDRNAFVTASTWPDLIRNDPRFADQPAGRPGPGFPDMGRHTNWHFINTAIPANFASQPADPDNAVSRLHAFIPVLRPSGPVTAQEAYALPWIVHLIGDLHQPLHTVARFSIVKGRPEHDRGGNGCYIQGGRNLHSLWDGLLGNAASEGGVARLAASLEDEHQAPKSIDRKPETWVREGVSAAASVVYSMRDSCLDRNDPAPLPAGYEAAAVKLARARAALAAYRTAAVLNEKLGH